MHPRALFRKIILFCLILVIIYPVSPLAYKAFFRIKEPAFINPVSSIGKIVIRSDTMGGGHFGARRSNGKRAHKGLDMEANIGDSVYASKSGLARTGIVPKGMGKYVKITHPVDGYTTIYGHLSSIEVKDRSWVWQGKVIGRAGKTGNANYRSIRPHLHFEIRKDGVPIDPLPLITNGKGD